MMSWKHIEASREIRLWFTQVIMPTLGITTALVATVPEFREAVVTCLNEVKSKIKNR